MVKKLYAIAVVLFLLTAVFVKDRPDFPKSSEIEILSENTTATHMPEYPGLVENRQYYQVIKTLNIRLDRLYTTAYCEVMCAIQPDENGKNQVVAIEYKQVQGGNQDYQLEKAIFYDDINPQYGFVHYMGRFKGTDSVSQTPLIKILPGAFIKSTDISSQWYFHSDDVDITLRLYADEIIDMAKKL